VTAMVWSSSPPTASPRPSLKPRPAKTKKPKSCLVCATARPL
jgi:hypothetical protein